MTACEELWISRAIDRCACAEDWRALHDVAVRDPDVWRRLCVTLESETALTRQLGGLLEPPDAAAVGTPVASREPGSRGRRWFGALAALLLATVAFVVGLCSSRWNDAERVAHEQPPTAVVADDPDALMHAYLVRGVRDGRVLEQLPLQAVSARRAVDGEGFDVVFVRSLVERARVRELTTLAPDEHGRPQPLRVDLANLIPPTDF